MFHEVEDMNEQKLSKGVSTSMSIAGVEDIMPTDISSGRRPTWDKESMIQAVKAVRNREMGYLRASKEFGVPKGTLERYVKNTSLPEELVVFLKMASVSRRKSLNKESMIRAVKAVRSRQTGYLRTSREFVVPKVTLERYVKNNSLPEDVVKVRLGRKPVLPEQMEEELA